MSMDIRTYTDDDLDEIVRIHKANGLPPTCLPACCKRDAAGNPINAPLFFVKKVIEDSGTLAMFGCLKLTAEAYVLVDHDHGTPEWRWTALQQLAGSVLSEGAKKGLEQVSCWLPPQLENSFAKRLEALGFVESPWKNWTANLE